MTNFNLIFLFLFIFFIQQSITQNAPVVPLTNALTTIYCHNSDEIGIMTIRCGLNEKIRMLDAFDVVVKNKSHLPFQCLKQKHFSSIHSDYSSNTDCKIPTSFTSACSGRENCTLYMQRTHLDTLNENCHNQLIDYTMAFFECISDVFIHDVCSSQAITSAWGTLKTPNFPNPYTSNDDCWCKLSTQLQHQLLLSIIVFQLIPYDQKCAGAGLYLQSSDEQRSTQCTYLQQGHNYLSDTNSLYINFYSRTSTVRGGFWIIYEATHPNAEVHLHCGSREKIGVPSPTISVSSPLISSSYNHGWSRLIYNNPTTVINDHMMRMPLFATTPPSYLDINSKTSPPTTAAGAFTYPYGRLTTFELDYGPRGWFLKYLFGSSNMTATKFLQTTTSQLPLAKWNSTWRYIRRLRPRIFTTPRTTTIKTKTKTKTTPISTTKETTTTTSTTTILSTIQTTEQNTIPVSSTAISMMTLQTVSAQQRLLFTHNPWIYDTTDNTESSIKTTTVPNIKSTTHVPTSSITSKTTLPSPTPWYPPAGLYDWWERSTMKIKTVPLETHTSTQKSTTTTVITTTKVTTNPTTTKSSINSNNTTNATTLIQGNQTTVDWFEWPHLEFTSTVKGQPDYSEEEYNEWPDYFAATKIQPAVTTNSLLYIPLGKQRQKFQQLSFLPAKSNEQFKNLFVTNLTRTSKRPPTQQYTSGINERNTGSNQLNEVTNANSQYINKKTSEENGWLSNTDMTIVGISILFVILLVLVNLILFAVRRHRHRVQGRHLLNSSSLNSRGILSNNHIQNSRHGIPINSLINTTNNNNNDILPAVGEIVIWDEKDQGGYMIDNQGEWAKIDGNQWFKNNLLKSFRKTSFTKSFRSRFQFIRQSNKKRDYHHQQQAPRTPQQAFKYPLLMDTASLSPVPEVDDYRLSDISSERTIKNSHKTIQALIHKERDQSDEYYKRIENGGSESNYTTMNGNPQGDYSIADQSLRNEMDGNDSVIISVPTMLRQEDETAYAEDSIYNQQYSVQSFERNKNLPTRRNNTIIVGHCQADFQPLDPKLLLKSTDKSLLADHKQFYSYSQSLQLSAYDSGFYDDQTMDTLPTTLTTIQREDFEKSINECINNDNDQENFSRIDLRKSNQQKRKH